MKKFWSIFMAMLLATGLLAACGQDDKEPQIQGEPETQEEVVAAFPVTIADALGKEITLEKAPEKIVSLTPSNTEILFGLNLENEVVGVSDNDDYPSEVAEKERIGGMEFNVEKIISLQPDIVFAHESSMYTLGPALEQFESAGVTVFVVKNAATFEETYTSMEQIGKLTGKVEEAEKMVESIKGKLAELQAKVEGQEEKSAFVVVGTTPDIYAVGQNTFMNAMLKTINVQNVVEADEWPMYSAEDFVASNPSTIIVTYEDDVAAILNNPAFAEMDAVKNGAVYTVDGSMTSRQGPRIADGVESIAKAIYPELFN
ncbi:ABC transporter substrate-binding protein [Metasolibacillus meyeri]|uniref:ABC transporter substrate-binding protein n=1 Tax=Metasolibacillus meyeri TaxID=1071052 RepID=A0AAW9NEY0_9BACL|nr:ABC transporter substrate-binding protein [Metasolibacillus meyeri]MEC1176899.1 ABC transporter substrate-binding protein [Metasolibacillus meyeri]